MDSDDVEKEKHWDSVGRNFKEICIGPLNDKDLLVANAYIVSYGLSQTRCLKEE